MEAFFYLLAIFSQLVALSYGGVSAATEHRHARFGNVLGSPRHASEAVNAIHTSHRRLQQIPYPEDIVRQPDCGASTAHGYCGHLYQVSDDSWSWGEADLHSAPEGADPTEVYFEGFLQTGYTLQSNYWSQQYIFSGASCVEVSFSSSCDLPAVSWYLATFNSYRSEEAAGTSFVDPTGLADASGIVRPSICQGRCSNHTFGVMPDVTYVSIMAYAGEAGQSCDVNVAVQTFTSDAEPAGCSDQAAVQAIDAPANGIPRVPRGISPGIVGSVMRTWYRPDAGDQAGGQFGTVAILSNASCMAVSMWSPTEQSLAGLSLFRLRLFTEESQLESTLETGDGQPHPVGPRVAECRASECRADERLWVVLTGLSPTTRYYLIYYTSGFYASNVTADALQILYMAQAFSSAEACNRIGAP